MKALTDLVRSVNAQGALVTEHGLGCLEVRGKDGLDLLHRLSTNDLISGPAHRVVRTVFTSEKGRVVADAEVVVAGSNTYLITWKSAFGSLRDWIERFTILEDISLAEVTDDLTVSWLLGPDSFSRMHFENQMETHFRSAQVAGSANLSCWTSNLGGIPGIRWLAGRSVAAEFLDAAVHAGRMRLDAASYDLIRIAAGTPVYPNELNSGTHPLEVGFREAISFTKGCYVGQEVVTRLDAYGKVQRQLVLLEVQGDPDLSSQTTEVVLGDQVLGHITSSSGPLFEGGWLALALCRKGSHTQPGTELSIRAGAQTRAARVRPFLGSDSPHPEHH